MTTQNQKLTLADVMEIIEDKLDEAKDFLDEMEKTSADRKRFRHRLSAFLSAAGSVTMFMKEQGTTYAQQINKEAAYKTWYKGKQSQFVTPTVGNKHAIGTDKTWVYLAVARNKTIHIQQTRPIRLNTVKYTEQLYARSSGGLRSTKPDEVLKESETVLEEPLLPDAGQTFVELDTLYCFKRLTIEDHGKPKTLDPPDEDVVTVCKKYIVTLELLIKDCEIILQ